MKNIKLRIVYLILGSALLLFALFVLAVNVIIPSHFVTEAKKALLNEAEYQNRTVPYTYNEPDYDEDWEEGYFFTPASSFWSWRTATGPTHGIGMPTCWRKSYWNTVPDGISHSISATPSKRTGSI